MPTLPHPDFEGITGKGNYADVLAQIDAYAGRIIDKVDELGISNNTIIIWTSDNGPEQIEGHHGTAGFWRGNYFTALEGSLRTVGMMRWPGKIEDDWKSKEMFHVLDFFTTFAAITGAEVPTDRPIDGVDQTEFLLGKQEHSNRDSRIVLYDGHESPVAVRYKQFKFHFITYNKINPFQGAPERLGQIPYIYNLDTDPKEMFNLFVRSGGIAVFEPMMHDVVVPYYMSLRKYPNKDYSHMTRSE